jgi:hypothetical protein
MSPLEAEVRRKSWWYLEEHIAAAGGLSLSEWQQAFLGATPLSDAQTAALARVMGIPVPPSPPSKAQS